MEKLFDDKERTENRYARHLEKSYNFYDSTAKPEFVAVREMLNDWFSRYPETDKRQLKGDFRTQFESAFFELFIHELFFRQGFTLTPHPTVLNSSKNPDFLAKKGNIEIYLEAKVATDKTNDERTLENKLGAIYDNLQNLSSPDYWIDIQEITFKSNKQVKLSRMKTQIQTWLAECHSKQQPMYNDYNDFGRECFSYNDDSVTISLSLFPSTIEKDHPIASYLGGSYSGGCEEALIGAIKEKGARYGHLDKPYIVCINLPGLRYPRTDEIYNTLFGQRRLLSNSNIFDPAPISTEMDGILKNATGLRFTQVSAFFITRVFESNLHAADHWLVEHTEAKNKMDLRKLSIYSEKIATILSLNQS
ncbi:hypothetical protein [Dyadobacter sp. LHD-138]|uniref:hypothetical protein n=1 Tax=Dyadobacter sp. LHD-138 TaxID=3071413 RepID=UPI0027DEF416|nr:hypothetical protein [Dyadobacter sp. LHD-138]MDQ6477649.1 hypothetical protein [Dyadobacter sp. LHD-138]